MSSTIRVDMTMNAYKALQALGSVTGGIKQMTAEEAKSTAEFKKQEKAIKDQERATAKLGREAKRVYAQSRTAGRKYTDQVKMLNLAKEKGILKEHEHASALLHVTRQMRNAGAASRQTGRDIREAGAANQTAFGSAALSRLGAVAAGYIGVSQAIRGVTTAFRQMNETRQEAADRQNEAEGGLGSLGQLALGDPVKFRKLVGAAKQTYREGGASSLDDAGRMIFQIESAGAMKDRKLFSDLRSRSLVEQPGKMAAATAALNKTMGAKETGGTRALISKGFAASAFSPSSVEEIMAASATSGLAGGLMGMRDEPILGATAILATQKVDAATAGTWLSQMMTTWQEKPELAGKTFAGALDETKRIKETMTAEEFASWFGRKQGRLAYEGIMKDRPRFEQAVKAIDRGQATDAAGQSIAAADAIPELTATRLQRQATARKELGETSLGVRRNLTDAMLNQVRARGREVARQSDHPRMIEFTNTAVDWGMRGMRTIYGDEAMLGRFGGSLPAGSLRDEVGRSQLTSAAERGGLDPDVVLPLFSRMADSLDQINSKTTEPPVAGSVPGDMAGTEMGDY